MPNKIKKTAASRTRRSQPKSSFGIASRISRYKKPLVAAFALIIVGTATIAMSQAATPNIVSRGQASAVKYASDSTKSIALAPPSGANVGDVLIASLNLGKSAASTQTNITPPAGWQLVLRTNHGAIATNALYKHVFAAGETKYTWTTDVTVGGTAFVSAFGGVDQTNPIDASAGSDINARTTNITAPAITTTGANDMIVSSYFGYRSNVTNTTWKPSTGMTEVGDANNNSSRSGSVAIATQAAVGSTGNKVAVASTTQDYAIASSVALRPVTTQPVTTPPTVSSVAAGSITPTGATVTWTTDQPATSQIDWGVTDTYGSSSTLDSTLATSHSQVVSGLSPGQLYHYRVNSGNANGLLASSADATFQTPAAPVASAATPLIIDTDMFSDADDVTALATAFGLQIKGEAKVIAININTRTSRGAVAPNSWKCAAAIAQFYGSGSIPIGTDTPVNSTAVNSPDFIKPCAAKAAATTPTPGTALSVYRQALANAADGSVVIASIGYTENLAALLNSPADSISPLSGRNLVALKVKNLVLMGGGYPSRSGETNLAGNPSAAQTVANNWPTKVIWSGYEVGDAVHTGNTVSSTHPTSSPVRVAYEAFVKPGNWIYSYDLTAVYHAIRPADSLLKEVGPGKNTVNSSGGNTFTLSSSGNQYYLKLSNATALNSSIESLIGTLK
jgi:purine nucleosidase